MGYDITISSKNHIYNQFLRHCWISNVQKYAKMMTLEPDEQELLISCPLGALPTTIIPPPSSSFRLTRSFNALMKGSASMALKSRADFFLLMFSWLMTISLAKKKWIHQWWASFPKDWERVTRWSWLDFFPKRNGKTPGKSHGKSGEIRWDAPYSRPSGLTLARQQAVLAEGKPRRIGKRGAPSKKGWEKCNKLSLNRLPTQVSSLGCYPKTAV